MDESELPLKIHTLTDDERKHLSLSTLIADPKSTLPPGVQAVDVLQSTKKNRKFYLGWKVRLLGSVLLVAGVTLGLLFFITITGIGSPVNNFFVGSNAPEPKSPSEVQDYSGLDLNTDADQDTIPDEVELLLGYDSTRNDCVRDIGCGNFPRLPKATVGLNLIFVLDASGSMGETVGGSVKWDSALSAMQGVLRRGFPRFTQIGVVLYGHKGGPTEEQKELSCAGVEVLESLSRDSTEDVLEKVSSLRPTGWTPLARALEQSGAMLQGQEGAGNFVVVLSDGTETCGGDPVAAARLLQDSGINVTTNVVGLAVSDQERSQLEAIAQAGGGQYFAADRPEDVEKALVISSEAVRLWDEINQCVVNNLVAYGQCINVQYLKSINWVKETRLDLQLQSDPLTGDGTSRDLRPWQIVEKKMWEKLRLLQEENWKQYGDDVESLNIR